MDKLSLRRDGQAEMIAGELVGRHMNGTSDRLSWRHNGVSTLPLPATRLSEGLDGRGKSAGGNPTVAPGQIHWWHFRALRK